MSRQYAQLLTKEFLIKEYTINFKSTGKIALLIGCDKATILNYLKKYKIKRKKHSEYIGSKATGYKDGRTINKKQYYREYYKSYSKANREKINKKQRLWAKNNRQKINKQKSEYYYTYLKYNINFKLLTNLRTKLNQSLKYNSKLKTTKKLLDCSIEFLKLWLKLQFKRGMNWNNYGKKGWHIDHIRPCCSFDLKYADQQTACFHYTNLQPLWAEENMAKGGKYVQ